ncbi:GDYXXLXY domain-containing protein [Roseibium sp. MMSF_3544]|uniref:GDYXXLXY domain-containing protein n=1 Tax=unclassified Roseibium TaxID=2629323 RepID=UPI00273F42B7|nr:GDYXXLXY domain-containing protein [Roseibium sp. MMSF_3544]
MSIASTVAGAAPKAGARFTYLKWGVLALIQLALLSIPLVDRLQVQTSGTVVSLELVPVDPRDLLRGDYVIINLAIGRISRDVPGADSVSAGEQVYVGLSASGDGPAQPVLVSGQREPAGDLAIMGTITSASDETLWIDYGIDAFFLPEGEGREIERLDTSRVLLDVAIAEDGRSLPLRLLVDGKAFKSDGTF